MLHKLRQRFGLKLFLSYLVIILIGVAVLAASAELVIPTAFDNHMSFMMDGSMMGMGMMGDNVDENLYTSFRKAFNEALTHAALAALIAAIVVSIFVSRQVVAPIHKMTVASQHIADGHYKQRVQVHSRPDDADELGQLAFSFNQMAERLAQTENIRLQLIGDVAHELRTPLTAIQGYMEGLMDGVLPATEETYQNVYREADRLKRLVNDLQELSRVEAGAYELNRKPVDPSSLVNTTVERLGRQFMDKGVILETELVPDAPNVMADEDRIGQVLMNLVGNALQYTPSGGRVGISTQNEDGEVRFVIVDTGIGIPAEHLPLLFTRFYRVDKSRSRAGGGSGIGLTISKYLVEAHGGQIHAKSDGLGKGSTFTFTLPITL